jgi:hypothetical protein
LKKKNVLKIQIHLNGQIAKQIKVFRIFLCRWRHEEEEELQIEENDEKKKIKVSRTFENIM